MGFIRRILRGKPNPTLESLIFDTAGLTVLPNETEPAKQDGVEVLSIEEQTPKLHWQTPGSDRLSLSLVKSAPIFPKDLADTGALRDYFDRHRQECNLHGLELPLVEFKLIDRQEFKIIRLITKAKQKPNGKTYFGKLLIPFADFYYEFDLQCKESGLIGMRESELVTRLLVNQEISIGDDGKIIGQWHPDAEKYDSDFINHPVSRVRKTLDLIANSLALGDDINFAKIFPLPAMS